MSRITPLDQEIIAWYESQTEELLRDLQDRFDAQTPRQAWKAFFNDCAFPATNITGESLAAPAGDSQGVRNPLAAARTVQWLLLDLLKQTEYFSQEDIVLWAAWTAQTLRVEQLECSA